MRISLMLVLAALLSGCVGGWPESPAQMRQQSRDWKTVQSFEVSRPLADVASAMRTKSAACLNVELKQFHYNPLGNKVDDGSIIFKPTFINHASWAELHVQRKMQGTSQRQMGNLPADGGYDLVMDFKPVSANRTKIYVYRVFTNDRWIDAMQNAVTHWTKGDNMGCPVFD